VARPNAGEFSSTGPGNKARYAGHRHRIEPDFRRDPLSPVQQARASLLSRRFHRIRSTHCAREGPGSNGSPKYCVSRATLPSRNSMMLTV
jgi:hypothetical protein